MKNKKTKKLLIGTEIAINKRKLICKNIFTDRHLEEAKKWALENGYKNFIIIDDTKNVFNLKKRAKEKQIMPTKIVDDLNGFMTRGQYAKKHNVSRAKITNDIKNRSIETLKIGNVVLVK